MESYEVDTFESGFLFNIMYVGFTYVIVYDSSLLFLMTVVFK